MVETTLCDNTFAVDFDPKRGRGDLQIAIHVREHRQCAKTLLEVLREHLGQLELSLEELEEDQAAGERPDEPAAVTSEVKRRRGRRRLPEHLPRTDVVHAPSCVCPACGGAMRKVGEDVTETLDYIPGRFEVIRHVRPAFSCRRCETMAQAPMPSLPIDRGRPGPGLLAHVLVSKYCDHLPLYRQAQIYAREGVDLDRATLADWVGKAAWLLQPLIDAIGRAIDANGGNMPSREQVRAAWRVFFTQWDVLLAPAFMRPAYPQWDKPWPETPASIQKTLEVNGQPVLEELGLFYPSVATVAGQPATALPVGRTRSGLPIGVQAVGPYLEDRTPLRFAALVAREFGGFTPPPGYHTD